MDGGTAGRVIDVRTPEEFGSGHVPGARNIPLDGMAEHLDEFRAGSGPVTVLCEVGGRSSRAADQLVSTGISALNVPGGTRAWREAGYPTE